MSPIPSMIYNAAVGGHVTNSQQIIDENENKEQSQINAEVKQNLGQGGSVDARITQAKNDIIGGASSNGNTLKKVEDRTATLETAVGSNGSVDQRIAAAKSEVIGDAASDYNTLGKLEDKIQAEASARQDALTAETNRATTRENQIYDLVHTPEQHYVTVATYADLANIASPSDDTIYRVSSYNGKTSQVDNTVYSEYGYDGTNFVFLCVKSQIDEVYDISAHHSNNTYVDLVAALDGGNNIPQELRRGGMSVKFVQSSDNKYIQYFLTKDEWSASEADWQKLNLEEEVSELDLKTSELTQNMEKFDESIKFSLDESLYISDQLGNVIGKFSSDGLTITDVKFLRNAEIISLLTELGNKVSRENGKGLSTEDFTTSLKDSLEGLSIFNPIYEDNFYIVDSQKNVVAKVDKNGIHSVGFSTSRTSIVDGENYGDPDKLFITDNDMNIIAEISSEGIHSVGFKASSFVDEDGKPITDNSYKDYELFTVGDSFSAGNYWNAKCAEILGCKFDPTKNLKPGMNISTGGTTTYGGSFDSAFFRVKNLYDQNVIDNDGERAIILLENVNDISVGATGSIQDSPMIPKTPIETDLLVGDFSSEFLDTIPENKRELDACISLKMSAWGKRLTITSLPTKEGDVVIGTGWAGPGWQYYSIHVVPQATEEETMSFVLNKILEYSYTGVTDIDGGDGKSVIFSAGVYNPQNPGNYATRLSFEDKDGTGMRCHISGSTLVDDVEALVKTPRFFTGTSIEEWTDTSKWVGGAYLNMYRAWRSCIEYLIWRFPKAHIMLTGFPNYRCNHNDYVRENGMRNQDAFNSTALSVRNRNFYAFLKELASFYNIPYIPVGEDCGINIINMSDYFPDGNVHPNRAGFFRMAECVAKHIKTYL